MSSTDPPKQFTILAGGRQWRNSDSERLISALRSLDSDTQIRCVLSIPEGHLQPTNEVKGELELPLSIELELTVVGAVSSDSINKFDLAICSTAEDNEFVSTILSGALPLIVLGVPSTSTFPQDAVIEIEDGEYVEVLLTAYL